MKARLLKKLLNDTGYIVANHGKYIAVGSPLCHDLIKMEKDTLKMTYALTFPKSMDSGEYLLSKHGKDGKLVLIWNKLKGLIDTGEIHDIINGQDEIENPLPVFTVEDGQLIETFTDKYGWPNTTIDGFTMYDNTYFKDKQKALDYGLNESTLSIRFDVETITEKRDEIAKMEKRIQKHQGILKHLNSLR